MIKYVISNGIRNHQSGKAKRSCESWKSSWKKLVSSTTNSSWVVEIRSKSVTTRRFRIPKLLQMVKRGGNRTAAKASGLPMVVEGDNDLSGTLAKYKKAMLNKRTVLKEVKDRLEDEKCTSCKPLVTLHINIVLFVLVFPFTGLLAC